MVGCIQRLGASLAARWGSSEGRGTARGRGGEGFTRLMGVTVRGPRRKRAGKGTGQHGWLGGRGRQSPVGGSMKR